MAIFSDNITIKFRDGGAEEPFLDQIAPGTGLSPLFRGELALLSNDEGLTLYALNGDNQVQAITAELGELAGVDLDNPQAGHVLVYNSNVGSVNNPAEYPGRPLNKWINVPAPRPDLYANSIFELGDVLAFNATTPQPGDALVWSSGNSWQLGTGVEQAILRDFQDVELTAAAITQGHTLIWNADSEKWNNGFFPESLTDLLDVDLTTTLPLDGEVLLYDALQGLWVAGAVAGGNANVVTLENTSTEPLPVASLTTLGVSQPEGDFYWVQDDNTNSWGKALQAGEVSFSDFKDVDLTGVQEGQALVWTFVNGTYKFLPQTVLPVGRVFSFTVNQEEYFDRPGFVLSTYGIEGARHYAHVSLPLPSSRNTSNSGYGLGMYGTSASEGGIHVSYDLSDPNDQENSFFHGCLKFPSDLQDDALANIRGIRPLNATASIPLPERFASGVSNFSVKFWVNFDASSVDTEIIDYGTIKIEIEQNPSNELDVIKSTYTLDGVTYSTRWQTPSPISRGTSYSIDWGIDESSNEERCYMSGVLCTVQGTVDQFVSVPSGAFLDVPDTAGSALPVIGRNLAGYLANLILSETSPSSFSRKAGARPRGSFPLGGVPGQTISCDQVNEQLLTRIVTKAYDPNTWAQDTNYSTISSFGSGTDVVDLVDVDILPGSSSGYLFYDSTTEKFNVETNAPTVITNIDYEILRSSDVDFYSASGLPIQEGGILAWDEQVSKFRPAPTNLNFRINDAEDVNTDAGLSEADTLYYNATAQEWQPGAAPNAVAGALGDLTDVEVQDDTLAENHTLLYSEALNSWVTGPPILAGSPNLSGMSDVDVTELGDGDVLSYNTATSKWLPTDSLVPKGLNDLTDVNTVSRPPREGQSLEWTGLAWTPGRYYTGGASAISELYDVKIEEEREGQSLIWNGSHWKNSEVHSGRGDGGDFDTSLVRVSFTSGIWGGGDFDLTSPDLPMEMMGQEVFQGGGDFF